MIASIFEFGETLVREVMVPRIDVLAVPVDTPMLEALDVILKAGHSRIPVYRETIDNVVGILYAKDLLRYLRDGRTDVPLSKILRPAYFIPESKKVDELLQELQQRKVHMAVVVDEYGGTAGIVTIEDLLEEIVGEIQDEYDAEEPTIEPISEHEYLFDARVPSGRGQQAAGGGAARRRAATRWVASSTASWARCLRSAIRSSTDDVTHRGAVGGRTAHQAGARRRAAAGCNAGRGIRG